MVSGVKCTYFFKNRNPVTPHAPMIAGMARLIIHKMVAAMMTLLSAPTKYLPVPCNIGIIKITAKEPLTPISASATLGMIVMMM